MHTQHEPARLTAARHTWVTGTQTAAHAWSGTHRAHGERSGLTHTRGRTRGPESPRGGGRRPGTQPGAGPAAGGAPRGRAAGGRGPPARRRPGSGPAAHLLRVRREDGVEGEHLGDGGGGRVPGGAARGPGGWVVQGQLLPPRVHLQEARGLGTARGGPDPQRDLHLGGRGQRAGLSTPSSRWGAGRGGQSWGRRGAGWARRGPAQECRPAPQLRARTREVRGQAECEAGTQASDRTGPGTEGRRGTGGEARIEGRLWTPPGQRGRVQGLTPRPCLPSMGVRPHPLADSRAERGAPEAQNV